MKNRETTLYGEQFETVLICLRDRMVSIAEDMKKAPYHSDNGEGCHGDDDWRYNLHMSTLVYKMSQVSTLYYEMVTQCDYVNNTSDGQTNNG